MISRKYIKSSFNLCYHLWNVFLELLSFYPSSHEYNTFSKLSIMGMWKKLSRIAADVSSESAKWVCTFSSSIDWSWPVILVQCQCSLPTLMQLEVSTALTYHHQWATATSSSPATSTARSLPPDTAHKLLWVSKLYPVGSRYKPHTSVLLGV
jgi:hypothetical protein